eukprot:2730735-Pyramimonas_sp.AAC.1
MVTHRAGHRREGDTTWATRVSLGNLVARLRDHPRDGSGVPLARTMWCDKDDYHWECPSCKKNYGKNKPGHVLTPGTCKFVKSWKLPDNHGQIPP